jgi:hypothetical protein
VFIWKFEGNAAILMVTAQAKTSNLIAASAYKTSATGQKYFNKLTCHARPPSLNAPYPN